MNPASQRRSQEQIISSAGMQIRSFDCARMGKWVWPVPCWNENVCASCSWIQRRPTQSQNQRSSRVVSTVSVPPPLHSYSRSRNRSSKLHTWWCRILSSFFLNRNEFPSDRKDFSDHGTPIRRIKVGFLPQTNGAITWCCCGEQSVVYSSKSHGTCC